LSIFDNKEKKDVVETPTTPTNEGGNVPSPASTQNDFADLLGVVVNDKGEQKYKSVPEAMKGLVHSQEHIKNLEAEMTTLRSELEKRASVEDALKQLTPAEQPVETPTPGLSMEDVNALLEQREQQKVIETNTKRVVSTIQEKFGDKAEEVFYGKAQELGMTTEQFNTLAAQSPNAVLAFFNTAAPTSSAVNQSSINTAAFQPKQEDLPTMIDHGELRLKMPKAEKSVLMGATNDDLLAEARRHQAAAMKLCEQKYGIKF